jgi:spore germination protein KA
MFEWMKRKVAFAVAKQQMQGNGKEDQQHLVTSDLQRNVSYIKGLFQASSDIVFRSFSIGKNLEVNAFLVAIDGLHDKIAVNENVLKPLMNLDFRNFEGTDLLTYIEKSVLTIGSIKKENSMEKSVALLMKGDPLLFVDGLNGIYVLGTRGWEMRSIEEPVTEVSVRGSREGFVETLRTNTSMLRRIIHDPKLQIEQTLLGEITQTDVAIAYMDGIASPEIVLEVKKRLQRIKIDAVLESGYIEAYIEDAAFSLFPTISNTERPDVVAARLLEGRVAIIVDGSTAVLTVPHLMLEAFQYPDDYYLRSYYVTMLRLLRMLGFLVSTLLPASFVAFQDFHKEIFPTDLLISLAAAREGVPFPLFIEVLIMLVVFEWLKEAGVRMPRPIGQAVSIVGALVIGEAAVNAGIIGAPTVIVIALSAITGFLIKGLAEVATLLRFLYLFVGGIFGMYGIMLVISILLLHVASLRSFGVPYMAPLFPITWREWKDFIVRAPLWAIDRRPESIGATNEIRQAGGLTPQPPQDQE